MGGGQRSGGTGDAGAGRSGSGGGSGRGGQKHSRGHGAGPDRPLGPGGVPGHSRGSADRPGDGLFLVAVGGLDIFLGGRLRRGHGRRGPHQHLRPGRLCRVLSQDRP